ncbi:hypothetical protein F2Q70_00002557 [Brassica cretica]|uniref:Uncharacterized protein n=1 Tax=Brassica cretica TaxID=69181 RepID=A0A8S9IRQ9_BRACR|nr:hypothetical protein F2Q70_00002557 [Brassica cretica]
MEPISAEQLAGFRKMVRRLPQNISFEHAWEIRPLHMFFKNCRESQEDIKALFTEALTPSMKVLPKVDDPGKFVFSCSIAGVEFKEAIFDSGSMVSGEQLEIVPKKEFGKKGEIKEVLDGDPHTDKLTGNARVKEKVQKKRVKGGPMMTLIPRLCNEKSIEYEVKFKGTSKHFSKVRVILTLELKEKGEAAAAVNLRVGDLMCSITNPWEPEHIKIHLPQYKGTIYKLITNSAPVEDILILYGSSGAPQGDYRRKGVASCANI